MDTGALAFARKYLEATTLHTAILNLPLPTRPAAFDLGLRAYLYDDFCYESSLRELLSSHADKELVFLSDIFVCDYCILRLRDAEAHVLLIGPYCQEKLSSDAFDALAARLAFPHERRKTIERYYRELPVVPNMEVFIAFMSTLAEHLLGRDVNAVSFDTVPFDEKTLYGSYSLTKESSFSLLEIEQRYAIMSKLLAAVSAGNTDLTLQYVNQFHVHAPQQRFSNALLDTKKWLVIFNTSLRIAAEKANIHPYYLDDISTMYAFRIESITDPECKHRVMIDMATQYCRLVSQQSVSNYSLLVQRVLIQVSYDLTADLSLRALSRQLNVNASYLSNLFKKEVGATLTEYVTGKRIAKAMELLRSGKLQIQEVAQYFVMCDLAYFTKLFKKQSGMTPSEYRSKMSEAAE